MTRLRAVAFSRFDGDKSFKRRRKAFGLDSRVPLVGDARDLNPGVPFFREISIYYPWAYDLGVINQWNPGLKIHGKVATCASCCQIAE